MEYNAFWADTIVWLRVTLL